MRQKKFRNGIAKCWKPSGLNQFNHDGKDCVIILYENDWSINATLPQGQEGVVVPIAYTSRNITAGKWSPLQRAGSIDLVRIKLNHRFFCNKTGGSALFEPFFCLDFPLPVLCNYNSEFHERRMHKLRVHMCVVVLWAKIGENYNGLAAGKLESTFIWENADIEKQIPQD